jgi:hypothetical protein
MDFKETEWEDVNWTELVQGRNKARTFSVTVLDLRARKEKGINFLTDHWENLGVGGRITLRWTLGR